ncbi:low temperature requirement protein A [Furfurilactobacillus curtus]|uniref:Low temperature requirement protein A n=1 Tax=Furfurilactobacillus curtus TaxID=1746200 RepID=A0ABQ5JSG5_9LACO
MQNSFFQWWRAPRKVTHQIRDRKISWLELFSDLAYVAIIHLITVNFATHWTLSGVMTFTLAFMLIFNSWLNIAWYYDLHGDDSLRTTVLLLSQVLAISLVAVFLPAIFINHWTGFLWTYLVVQTLITYIWWSTGHFDPDHRVTSWPYVRYYCGAGILLIIAIIVANPTVSVAILWSVFIIDFGTPFFTRRRFDRESIKRQLPFEISASLLERFGQFTMIILGEALADLIDHGIEETTMKTILLFCISLLFVVAIWWLYYMLMDNLHIHGHSYLPLLLFRLLHTLWLFVLTGLIFSLSYLPEPHHSGIQIWFSIFAVMTFLLLQGLANWNNWQLKSAKALLWQGGVLMCLLIGAKLAPIGQIGLSTLGLLVYILSREPQLHQ